MLNIPRRTVIDCIQRYGNLKGLEDNLERASKSTPDETLKRIRSNHNIDIQKAYAYLLGIYLGDGYIVRNKRVYFLRVALDTAYPNIINLCCKSIQTLLPENKVNVLAVKYSNGCEVVCSYKFWPDLFPQHGEGLKHTREIKLHDWQQTIIEAYPLEFFRGLFHSDGSRFSNVVNGTNYPRYQFTNYSSDIRRLFCDTCEHLGLHWTEKAKLGKTTDIFISKRPDVAFLDLYIGPKT